ncbi:transposase [Bradyrhizobium sp. 179]|nr:transposase [Bradyrhizobium sp. 179]
MKLLWRGQCRAPRLCTLLPFTSATERNVFGHTSFCRAGLNRIERLNDEIKRQDRDGRAFPNEGAIVRLVCAILSEQPTRAELSVEAMHSPSAAAAR